MTNTASKLKRALCSMVVMLALMAGITSVPVLAASNGIYTATATSHYRHPTICSESDERRRRQLEPLQDHNIGRGCGNGAAWLCASVHPVR